MIAFIIFYIFPDFKTIGFYHYLNLSSHKEKNIENEHIHITYIHLF